MATDPRILEIMLKLAPPINEPWMGYMVFNIRDFQVFPQFQDNGEWFYENRYKRVLAQESDREIVYHLLISHGAPKERLALLTEEECTLIKDQLVSPLYDRDCVILEYGHPDRHPDPGMRFLKVTKKNAE